MTDYISREAAIKLFNFAVLDCLGMEPTIRAGDIIKALESIPAADVREVKLGKWIPDYDYTEYDYDGSTPLSEPQKFQDGWQCGLCGQYMPSETNFCPNCGADMRGDNNG